MANAKSVQLNIEGMHCASCVSNIERGVSELNGVTECRVNLAMKSAVVIFDNGSSPDAVVQKISDLGFSATVGELDVLQANAKELQNARQTFWTAFYLSVPLMVFSMLPMFTGASIISPFYDGVIQAVLAAVVLFYSGRSILADALKQLKHRHSNMNTLIAMGTLTAFGWSVYALVLLYLGKEELLFFESSAMIITLILLGRYLEAKSKGKAGEAIQSLMQLTPSKALALINNVELEIEIGAVKPGMQLIVRPGERLPADGEVLEGDPHIDESMLTGESVPVEKSKGAEVYGGSLNGNFPFTMIVTASGDKTFLSSIIRLVSDAQSKKAPVQKLADKVAGIFVPIVLGISLVTLAFWLWLAPDSPILMKSVISVMIIACPCALGLATPTAILAGSGFAAKNGIIFRGGDIIEKVNKLNTLVFDKTGTLTYGELEVADIQSFGQLSSRNLIRIIGSAELQSEHPIARAIVRHMQKEQIEKAVIKQVETYPGNGLKAEVDSREILIGNKSLMETEEVSFGQALLAGEREMEKGRTVVFAAMDKQVVGLIALADKVRHESKDVISRLQPMFSKILMLSGDSRKTAGGVARTIGIEEFEAELKPNQKKMIIESLSKAGFKVGMIGDGINDAPALATADIGIGIGSGTDIAIESSDVVLVRDDLTTLVYMFTIASETMRIIKQNLFWAFFYNLLAIPLAAGLFYPLFGWTLSPIIAAAAMSLSSFFVVSNSLRLNRLDLK